MIFQDFGRAEKKLLLLVLSLLFCFWLWGGCATVSASGTQEKTYQITETQLKSLETKLNLLDQILAQQNPELTTLQIQLAESRTELKQLREELNTSRQQLTKAEESLKNANEYLKKCAEEEKRTRLRIKAQRNFWEVVAAAAVVVAIAK